MSRKIDGFYKLRKWGLNAPEIEVVRTPKEIKWKNADKEYCGWIARSALDEGNELSLPFISHVDKQTITKKILEFKEKLGEKAKFIVYPCWKFIKSGNLMILKDSMVIEAVEGYIRETPEKNFYDVHYTFQRKGNKLPHLANCKGKREFLTYSELIYLIHISRKISEENIIIEWSIDEKGTFHFHDLIYLKNGNKENSRSRKNMG